MKTIKTFVLCFVVGGAYAVIGQVLLLAYTWLLGPQSSMIGPFTLVTLGILALAMYVPGIHQKIAAVSGLGSVFVFNGLAGGVASAFEEEADKTGSFSKGAKAATMLIVYLVGFGGLICMLIGLLAFFTLHF